MTDDSGQLQAGLARLGLQARDEQIEALLAYLETLRTWNRTYNLIAPGEINQLISRHLLDSLAISPYIRPGNLLDVGSGAGFPGLPLAILRPEDEFTLLDSVGKKVRFLSHVSRQLRLKNVNPVQERIERFLPGSEFSTITSRAFASLAQFAASVRHLSGPTTKLLAMKGRLPEAELEELPAWVNVEAIHHLEVPGLQADRQLVVMSAPT